MVYYCYEVFRDDGEKWIPINAWLVTPECLTEEEDDDSN